MPGWLAECPLPQLGHSRWGYGGGSLGMSNGGVGYKCRWAAGGGEERRWDGRRSTLCGKVWVGGKSSSVTETPTDSLLERLGSKCKHHQDRKRRPTENHIPPADIQKVNIPRYPKRHNSTNLSPLYVSQHP